MCPRHAKTKIVLKLCCFRHFQVVGAQPSKGRCKYQHTTLNTYHDFITLLDIRYQLPESFMWDMVAEYIRNEAVAIFRIRTFQRVEVEEKPKEEAKAKM